MKKKREKKKKKKMSQQETKYYSYYIYTPTGAEDLYSNLVTDLVYLLCCLLASLQRLLSPSSFLYCILYSRHLVSYISNSSILIPSPCWCNAAAAPLRTHLARRENNGQQQVNLCCRPRHADPPLPSLWAPSRSTPTTDALSLSKFTSTTSSC